MKYTMCVVPLILSAITLRADVITFSTTVSATFASGVDLELTVLPNGSVDFGIASLAATPAWNLGTMLAATIPSGGTITSATLTYVPPTSVLTQQGRGPTLFADASSDVTLLSFGEMGCGGDSVPTVNVSSPTSAYQFLPCPTLTAIDPLFTGSTSVNVTGWTTPTAPGTYENGLMLSETLDYSLAVTYNPPPVFALHTEIEVLPEPWLFWPVAGAVAAIVIIRGIIYMTTAESTRGFAI